MLSHACSTQIDRLADGVAVYVALELPAIWEAAILMSGSIVEKEFGSHMAILHPPHVTLHPPFFPIVSLEKIVYRIEEAVAELPAEPINFIGLASFDDEEGVPSQVILKVGPSWCRKAHSRLTAKLSDCWDSEDPLTMHLWPSVHRLDGYEPHVSLAIGDLPAAADERKALKLRITELLDQLFRLSNAPLSFVPARLSLIAYRHDWNGNRYKLDAGPNLLAVIPLSELAEEKSTA